MEPFLFYVMTENDSYGCHFVGYFSKEKRPSSLNNVSCILVLPIHQRKGYGQYLIEFSYLLTRVEKKTGSPEKPLSDMGLVAYRKYWRLMMCEELLSQKSPVSITAIADRTGITPDDIVSALEALRALVRDPITGKYALRLDYAYFKSYIDKYDNSDSSNPKIKPECLVWTPYVMGRLGQYEDGPTMHAVQQRDEVDDDDQPEPEEGVQMTMAAKTNGTSKNGSAGGEDEEGPGTPALLADDSINGGSPAPGTPLANGSTVAIAGSQITSAASVIPATRYEVFPPVPGHAAPKRRPGRPFGSRRRTSTPQRHRSQNMNIATAPVSRIRLPSGNATPSANGAMTPGTISLRRGRSQLGQSVTNGFNDEDEDDDDDDDEGGEVRPHRRRHTRSSTGSPRTAKKGKGRVVEEYEDEEEEEEEEDEDEDEEDAEINDDEDQDAEGEEDDMDIDAEGEDDDDIIMPDA